MPAAFISGCAALSLSDSERDFFRECQPAGLILFQRNCESPDQVRALTDDFRSLCDGDVLVLVDQEGGRVQRMAPPNWRALPAAKVFADLYAREPDRAVAAVRLVSQLCAHDLQQSGINMNCVPVLDVPAPDGHEIIGTRAYGSDVATIVALGRAVAEGHMAGGVAPVIKHIPGHGRATADSHLELPRVSAPRDALNKTDFDPFKQLHDMPAGMTAHVVYDALDPTHCASVSASVISKVIRGSIGFDGLLMSDDLSMKALEGDMETRARGVLDAGCDVALHCNGHMDEMLRVAAVAGPLTEDASRRLKAVFAAIAQPQSLDLSAAEGILAELLTMASS